MLFDFISIGGFIVCGIILELTEFLGTGELLFEVIGVLIVGCYDWYVDFLKLGSSRCRTK